VYPSRPKALFEEIAKAVDAEVIILGHTHIQMHIQVDGQIIINPGAVYGNASSDSVYDKPEITRHTCGVLSLPELSFDIYDIESGERVEIQR
jgi:predicted phosphodiesterase